nr:apolipoprotein D-like [Lytechinus pictus]
MKQLALLLLLGLAGFSSAQVFGFGGCPEVRLAEDFQLDRYLGRWYEITKFYASFEAGISCVTAEYRPGEDGQILVINTGRTRDGEATSTILGEILQPNPDEGAKLQVQFFNRPGQTGEYWVLDVDYDSYALVHGCTEIFFGWFNFQNNWVLARDPFPSEDVIQNALRKFGEQGINVDKFIRADQTNCETEPPRPTERPGTYRPRPSEGTDRPRPSEGTDRPRPSENPDTERPRPSEGTDRPRPSEGTDRPRPSENPDTERPRPSEGTDRPRPSEGTDRPRPTEPPASERPRL